jgi:hypothetical protein
MFSTEYYKDDQLKMDGTVGGGQIILLRDDDDFFDFRPYTCF